MYADSCIVIGPLATYAEPHTYDMCADHAARLTPPRGWQVMRLDGDYAPQALHSDDLLALADAVATKPGRQGQTPPARASQPPQPPSPAPEGRRRHLRALPEL